MKKFGLLFLAVGMVAGLTGCPGKDNSLNCVESIFCNRTGRDVLACCNKAGTQCEYQTGDRIFPCDGTACFDAASSTVNYCER